MLRAAINNSLKDAMKSRDERRVSTLRLMNAAIKNADIEASGQGKAALNEAELLSLFQKMIKQRQESADLYDKGDRAELAAAERAEIEIIASYLPKQMSDAEAGAAISTILQEINARDHEGHGPRHGGAAGALRRPDGLRQGQRQDQGPAEQEVTPFWVSPTGRREAARPGDPAVAAPHRKIRPFSSPAQALLKVFPAASLQSWLDRQPNPQRSNHDHRNLDRAASRRVRARPRRREDPPAGRLDLRRLRRRRRDAADRRRRALRDARPALRPERARRRRRQRQRHARRRPPLVPGHLDRLRAHAARARPRPRRRRLEDGGSTSARPTPRRCRSPTAFSTRWCRPSASCSRPTRTRPRPSFSASAGRAARSGSPTGRRTASSASCSRRSASTCRRRPA